MIWRERRTGASHANFWDVDAGNPGKGLKTGCICCVGVPERSCHSVQRETTTIATTATHTIWYDQTSSFCGILRPGARIWDRTTTGCPFGTQRCSGCKREHADEDKGINRVCFTHAYACLSVSQSVNQCLGTSRCRNVQNDGAVNLGSEPGALGSTQNFHIIRCCLLCLTSSGMQRCPSCATMRPAKQRAATTATLVPSPSALSIAICNLFE